MASGGVGEPRIVEVVVLVRFELKQDLGKTVSKGGDEVDCAWADLDNDGDVDLVVVVKEGFTATGKPPTTSPIRSIAVAAPISLKASAVRVSHGGVSMPFSANRCLATDLSHVSALATTPGPVYWMPRNSMSSP